MISKEKKIQIVEDLTAEIQKAKAVYLASFLGLKVSEIGELREELRRNSSTAQAVKKNLAQVAFSKSGYKEKIVYDKNGSLMVSFAFEDPLKTAKILWSFSKKNEKFQILGGIAENKFLNPEEVAQLAKISSQDILFGRIVGSMSSPTQRLLYALNGNIQKLVIVLGGIKTTPAKI
ncbi:MAG: 50S ribosomal protein L10 [Candidatus Pacebacteria bacterium]|nr:50S ribosomal protein L10 [Candidatus Paceibacterota bacterium]